MIPFLGFQCMIFLSCSSIMLVLGSCSSISLIWYELVYLSNDPGTSTGDTKAQYIQHLNLKQDISRNRKKCTGTLKRRSKWGQSQCTHEILFCQDATIKPCFSAAAQLRHPSSFSCFVIISNRLVNKYSVLQTGDFKWSSQNRWTNRVSAVFKSTVLLTFFQ